MNIIIKDNNVHWVHSGKVMSQSYDSVFFHSNSDFFSLIKIIFSSNSHSILHVHLGLFNCILKILYMRIIHGCEHVWHNGTLELRQLRQGDVLCCM